MSRQGSITRLFKAFDRSADSSRAEIYLDAVSGESDVTVDAAVTRTLRLWKHVSLPPIGKLIEACESIRKEDETYRKKQQRSKEIDPDWIRENDRAHCKLIAELYAEGLDYCDVTGKWLPFGKAVCLPAGDVRCRPMQIAETQKAVDAVRAGLLVGNAEVRAQRVRGKAKFAAQRPGERVPRAQRAKQLTHITDAQAECF